TYPDETFETVSWDPAKPTQPHHVTNRMNQSTWLGFDEHGLPTRSWGPAEDPSAIQDFNITKTWDTWDRLETVKDTVYAAGVHHLTHDLTGRVTELDGPWDEDTITWTYDDANRKVTRASPGSISVETARDAYGRLDSITDPLGNYQMGYFELSDMLISVTHSGGFNTAFQYFNSDLGNALKNIVSKKGTQEIARHDYTYDSLGRIQTWKRSAPLANPGTTNEYEWTLTHDFAGQLTGVVEKALSGELRGGWTYGYDPAGNRYSSMHSGAEGSTATAATAAHNSMNQITALGGGGTTRVAGTLSKAGRVSVGIAEQGEHPARMLPGNRFEAEVNFPAGTSTLAVEAADESGNRSSYRYTVATDPQDAREFAYDEAGNLTDDGVRTYEWDSLSRLKMVTWADGVTTEFKYNALGQRAEIIETESETVTTHHFYLYDGISLVERRTGTDPDAATTDLRYFSNGEQRLEGAAWQSYHYCRDHLGSVREVLASDGTLVARYDYTPYGERITRHEASGYTACDIGFTGHISLPSLVSGQTDLVLTHYRAYDPWLGSWLSADPIGEKGGSNLYQYVSGSTIDSTDTFGLARVRITTDTGKGFDKVNPSPQDVRDFIKSLGGNDKIRRFDIDGHGSCVDINVNDQTKQGIEITPVAAAGAGPVTWTPVWTDTSGSLLDDLKAHVDKNTKLNFDGCNTANEREWLFGYGSKNNISRIVSETFPGAEVTGNRGFGFGNNPFTGNANGVIGIGRTYVGGKCK
ncbi:MAG: RHS repeat-associated core domain-containing protein, partial [Verrucomicrobiota bacterium]